MRPERLEDVTRHGRPGRYLLIDEVLAIGDGADGPDELTWSGIVEDVSRSARLDGGKQLVIAASVAEEQDGGAGALVLQPLDRGNDLVDRELGIDEDDVRHRLADHVDRFIHIAGLRDHLDLRVSFDDLAQDATNEGGMLADEDQSDVLEPGSDARAR